MATLATTKAIGLVLVVFSIDRILSDGVHVESISTNLFPHCTFIGKLLKLTHVDESESFLVLPHEYLDKLADIDGVFCIPVKMIDETST